MQYIPYVVYGIALGIFLLISWMAIYHMHRFGVEWDRTKSRTYAYILYSLVFIGISAYYLLNTDWSDIFS